MGWRATAERARWRIWQLATLGAVLATLLWARGRFGLLSPPGGPRACPVVVSASDVLPADCWLRRGVVGIVATGATDPTWVGFVGAVASLTVALVIAGSSARRQRSVVLVGFGWAIGMWVSFFAFEANARAIGGGWWGVRVVAAAPAVVVTVLSLAAWSQSPWTTLEAPGLRSRRRRVARRARRRATTTLPVGAPPTPATLGGWPEVSTVPRPLVLRWPVPASTYLPAGVRSFRS